MLSDSDIAAAKKRVKYGTPSTDRMHEHDDCIRIAYEWLDAQKTIKSKNRHHLALKHIIEKWGGRYVSQNDVEVAAELHPRISGEYPHFNLSKKLTQPSDARLNGIAEAYSQDQRKSFNEEIYKHRE